MAKQDSYGHAIYHGAAKTGKNVKKQGELELGSDWTLGGCLQQS